MTAKREHLFGPQEPLNPETAIGDALLRAIVNGGMPERDDVESIDSLIADAQAVLPVEEAAQVGREKVFTVMDVLQSTDAYFRKLQAPPHDPA